MDGVAKWVSAAWQTLAFDRLERLLRHFGHRQAKSGVDPIAKRRRDALLSATNDASLQAMVAEAFQADLRPSSSPA
jgi:hypothetical protein